MATYRRVLFLLVVILVSVLSGCSEPSATISKTETLVVSDSSLVPSKTNQPMASSTPTVIVPTETDQPIASSTPTVIVPTETDQPTASSTPTNIVPTDTATPPTSEPVSPLVVNFIDVGQGDSILIRGPDGKTMVIDGGESGSGSLAYLQSQGIKNIDLMVATHPHSDHIGGLVDILQTIPVAEVVTNGQSHTTATYERFLDAIANAQAIYTEVKRGDQLKLGSLVFDVIRPDTLDDDLNNSSLVLRIQYGSTSFLFTGDVQEAGEENMLASGLPVQATILKVAHHGSASSSSRSLLNVVRPAVAVYSAGLGNDYGHPRPETLSNLAAVGSQIFGTDRNGTVSILADGTGYSVSSEKSEQIKATPTETATILPVPDELTIQVASLTSPISRGGMASLTVQTSPGASCEITVYYKSGPSQADGLGPQTADGSGYCSWSWKVGTRTTPGVWSIKVDASLSGQTESLDIPFEVR